MKSLKFVMGLEASSRWHPDKLQYIIATHCKRTHFKFVPQIAHPFLYMQVFNNYNTSCPAKTVSYNNLRAASNGPSATDVVMGSQPASHRIEPTTHAEMIKDYFDVSKSTAYRMLEKDNRLKNCDVHILARNMNMLQENGVDAAEVRNHMALLCRCPLTAEHFVGVMKELGLKNLAAEHFAKFNRFIKVTVAQIKRWGLLPDFYDPLEELTPLGIPNQIFNDLKLLDINNLTLEELHWKLSIAYLTWCLDCSKEEISKLNQTYRLGKKSIRLQHRVLDQLMHDWNINIAKVRQNGYLLTCSPANMALIDSKVKSIAGVDVRECAAVTPRILCIPYHQLLQVSDILSKLPISTAAVKALPRICTLHPDTLKERINYLQQNPEFSAFQSHPRMLHLIYYHNKITSRLDLLQEMKKSNVVPSLNKLSGTKKLFNKYMTVGDLRQNKRDIITCLSQNLGVKPTSIRKCLHLHCWGSQTTVINVQKNLLALQREGFTPDQLMAGLDVVLYPPDLLNDQLTQLPQRPQVQPYSSCKYNINILQHLLYFMDKNASLT